MTARQTIVDTPVKSTPVGPLALVLLVIMGAVWGLQFAMLKMAALGGYSEINILMLTLILLSIVFCGLQMVWRLSFKMNRERLVFLLITAILGYVVPLLTILYAAPHLPAGILTLMACLAPVVSVLIALALRTEFVSLQRVLAILCGLAAIGLVLWPQLELPGLGSAHWMALMLLVPVCYGMESVYVSHKWPAGWVPLQAVTGETVMAAILMIPVFLIFGDPIAKADGWTPMNWGAEWAIVVFVATGVIESMIYFHLVKTTGGVFVGFGTFIALFAGMAWGYALFGEQHGAVVWLAVAALCVALALAGFERSDAERRS